MAQMDVKGKITISNHKEVFMKVVFRRKVVCGSKVYPFEAIADLTEKEVSAFKDSIIPWANLTDDEKKYFEKKNKEMGLLKDKEVKAPKNKGVGG